MYNIISSTELYEYFVSNNVQHSSFSELNSIEYTEFVENYF